MADIISDIFKNKSVNPDKLEKYGFVRSGKDLVYSKTLSDSGFLMTVVFKPDRGFSTRVTDPETGEAYVLHLSDSASGSFVGAVRAEYEGLLCDIAVNCCEPDIFKTEYAKKLIDYAERTYGDEPEFLWTKFPNNAIWRRKDNKKWYGALLTVSKQKLGFKDDESVEIIDLRIKPEESEKLIDGIKYLPGYHMNKKHWYTIVLDGSVPIDEIYKRLNESYILAHK